MHRCLAPLLAVVLAAACTPEPAPSTSSPTVPQGVDGTAPAEASAAAPPPLPSKQNAAGGADKLIMSACNLRVAMPAPPTCNDSLEQAPIGPIQIHACRVTTRTKPLVVFVAGCSDYPADYVARVQDPDGMLGAALQGEVRSSGGTQRSVTAITTHGVAGKEAVIDIGDALMVTRVYIRGRRIFHFAVMAPDRIARAEAPAFFRTIELPAAAPDR